MSSSILGVAIVTGGVALGVTSIGNDAPPAPPAGNKVTTPADLNPRVTATIEVGQFPRAVSLGEGYLWVTSEDPTDGFTLTRIDPETNEVADTLSLKHAADLAVGAGSVWLISYDDDRGALLLRIDPKSTALVETIQLDCVTDGEPPDCFPGNLAADDTAVWVTLSTQSSGEVVRVDPTTNKVVARIPIGEDGPRDIVVAGGSVWVNVQSDVEDEFVQGASLHRIDPQSNEVVDVLLRNQLLLGGDDFPPVITAGDNDVWVVRTTEPGGTRAVRVDAHTGTVIGESRNLVPDAMGPGIFPIAVGEGGMWFYGGGEVAVRRLNAETMQVDESVDVSDDAMNVIDAVLDPIAGTIWVASYEGPVVRIDLQ